MPRMIILSLVLAIIGFLGLIAIDSTSAAAPATTQSQVACHFDPSLPIGYEVAPAKNARPGECVVIQAVDESYSILSIRATQLKDPMQADAIRIWTNFDSIESARQFACQLVRGARQAYPGYLVATDLRCFVLRIGGVVRN